MIARMPTQKDQIMKEYSLFGGPDRLKPARDIIMRGDLSGKRSRTPAWQRGFSAEKDEDTSQDPMEDNDTCTARQFWKGYDLPVPEPDSWVSVDSAYGFGISRPAPKTSSWTRTIRRPVRVSFASVDDAPEAFPCPIICRCVCEDYDPWLWQPLPVPSTWTWDATSSYRQDWSQWPAAMEADTFPCFLGFPHPDSSWSLSVTLDTLSNYPQERRLPHANSDEEVPLRGPLVDPMSSGGLALINVSSQNLSAQNSSLCPHPRLRMWSPNRIAPIAPFLMSGPATSTSVNPDHWIRAQDLPQTATLLFSQIPGSATHKDPGSSHSLLWIWEQGSRYLN